MELPAQYTDLARLAINLKRDKFVELNFMMTRLKADEFHRLISAAEKTELLQFITQGPQFRRCFPELVADFYIFFQVAEDGNIISTVGGQPIVISKGTMMETLHLSRAGSSVGSIAMPNQRDLWSQWTRPGVEHNDYSHRLKDSLRPEFI
ncbi:hypothetical protein C2S51_027453 [Perilla frutescens var. frutescens]|nr:hypothetical protein C2S51_027453 [Perilla frutescens var. frutescens]